MAKTTSKALIPATLIPGDGIGPEIIKATVAILDALGAPFAWDIQTAGMAAVKDHLDPLPEATLASIRRTMPGVEPSRSMPCSSWPFGPPWIHSTSG